MSGWEDEGLIVSPEEFERIDRAVMDLGVDDLRQVARGGMLVTKWLEQEYPQVLDELHDRVGL